MTTGKWLMRAACILAVLLGAAILLVLPGYFARLVSVSLIVVFTLGWVVAWRGGKESIKTLGVLAALVLAWLVVFIVGDTPPSTLASQPASFISNGTGRIVFLDHGQICLMNADGTGKTTLTGEELNASFPAWSPDGDQIAFVSSDEIYVMNADGTKPTRLTNSLAASNQAPNWSPDGKRIAFLSNREGDWEAYVMQADGSRQTRLTRNYQHRHCTPAWSPDGQRLAFSSSHSVSGRDIYVLNPDGAVPMVLPRDLYEYKWTWRAGWSPDGGQVAFIGENGVYVMNADGSNRTRLADISAGSYGCSGTVWSPDGARIAFVAAGKNDDAYVMNADGTELAPLTKYGDTSGENSVVIYDLVWSPDGTRMAYSTGWSGLYVMDRDGDNKTLIGQVTGFIGDYFDWAP